MPGPAGALPIPGPAGTRPIPGPRDALPIPGPADALPIPGPTEVLPMTGPADVVPVHELQVRAKLPQVGALAWAGAQPQKCCTLGSCKSLVKMPVAAGRLAGGWGWGWGRWREGGAAAGGLRRLPGWGGPGQALEQSQTSGGGSSGWGWGISRTGDLMGPRQEGECGWKFRGEASPSGTPSRSCVLGGRLQLPMSTSRVRKLCGRGVGTIPRQAVCLPHLRVSSVRQGGQRAHPEGGDED